jgi:hypothetical protein
VTKRSVEQVLRDEVAAAKEEIRLRGIAVGKARGRYTEAKTNLDAALALEAGASAREARARAALDALIPLALPDVEPEVAVEVVDQAEPEVVSPKRGKAS